MLLLALILCAFQDEARLDEIVRALDADDGAVRTNAQRDLEAFLDREPRATLVRERAKKAEGEAQARLRKALEGWEFGTSDHIAFIRDRRLWIMTDKGRCARPLVREGDCQAPAFSPDGKRIAFASNRTGEFELYLIDFDGKNEVQLTTLRVGAYDPAFSPDGNRIAFSHDGEGKGIQSIDLEGGTARVLSRWGEWPSYSPDGKRLLFTGRDRAGQGNVFVRELDAQGEPLAVTQLAKPKALNFHARFSPDGTKIVFVGWNPGAGGGLYVANSDGKDLTAQRRSGTFFAWPSFLPDGKRILCVRSPMDLRGINNRDLKIAQPEIVIFEDEGEVVLGEGTFPAWGPKPK